MYDPNETRYNTIAFRKTWVSLLTMFIEIKSQRAAHIKIFSPSCDLKLQHFKRLRGVKKSLDKSREMAF